VPSLPITDRAKSEISGYADKVAGVGKAARLIKNGSYIGVALGVGATGLEIQKACTLGREEDCSRAQFVELALEHMLAHILAQRCAQFWASPVVGQAHLLAQLREEL